ncbi:MAG TPA: hypothetical protein VHO24_11035 [Opitutaceae bacterium]|nr:hypothetical protein [Opitutaceae bacterium]
MKYLVLLLGLFVSSSLRADLLGETVEITPVAGWGRMLVARPSPFPTLQYVPKDGRNASVLITLFPADAAKVTDLPSLKKFLRVSATPYLSAPDAEMNAIERGLPQGFLVYASFEDPDLVGKPSRKGNYKIATPAAAYLGSGPTLQVTIFTDRKDGADLQEALQIVQSASLRRTPPKAPVLTALTLPKASTTPAPVPKNLDRQTVGFRTFSSVLLLPMRFERTPKLNSEENYFSFIDEKHVILSGWLDHAAGFNGMKEFWVKEKNAMTGEGGLSVAEESFTIINGWTIVRYVVRAGDAPPQKNIRACRVVGDTWADIHLSTIEPAATWKDLEDVVKELSLAPK